MRNSICAALVCAAVAASPAKAWQFTIEGAPGFRQSLAPSGALDVNASGDVCVLSNDQDGYGSGSAFAHLYVFHAADGALTPAKSIGARAFATIGVDCSPASPLLGYFGYDDYAGRREAKLTGFMPDPSTFGPAFDLPAYGAVAASRFGADAQQHVLVLRDKAGGNAYDLTFFDLATLAPRWQTSFVNSPLKSPRVVDMQVAADGSSTLAGTFDDPNTPTVGLFLLRYAPNGAPSGPMMQFGDPTYPEVGASVLTPGGVGYFVRSNHEFLFDQLWRVDAGSWGMPLDMGCCGSRQVLGLVALADDGALAATSSYLGAGAPVITRYSANGMLLWTTYAPPLMPPAIDLVGLVGDRAGRALVVTTEPSFGGPPQAARMVRLTAYSETGAQTWSRTIDNVRFDAGAPLRAIVSSDDRVVLALNVFDPASGAAGILVQGFALDQPLP